MARADKKPRRSKKHDHQMEPVAGGSVRRIVFGEPQEVEFNEVEPTVTERIEYRPRHHATMDEIEFEVDNLERIKAGLPARKSPIKPDARYHRTVFRSETGEVREAHQPWGGGTKKTLYTSTKVGGREEERRFHSSMVDSIIEGVTLEEEDVIREETYEEVPVMRVVKEKKPKKIKAKKGDIVVEPVGEYQPQCLAVTKDGLQCRNSAKDGSDMCGSHQDYLGVTADEALAARDTAPRVEGAEDTVPGEGATNKDADLRPQCAAYTKNGLQCRNSARKKAKYCGSHKGYRPPTKKQLLDMMDTKPRWSGAPDTAPKLN